MGSRDYVSELGRLNLLILNATRLGFADDVAHWEAERKRVMAEMRATDGNAKPGDSGRSD